MAALLMCKNITKTIIIYSKYILMHNLVLLRACFQNKSTKPNLVQLKLISDTNQIFVFRNFVILVVQIRKKNPVKAS